MKSRLCSRNIIIHIVVSHADVRLWFASQFHFVSLICSRIQFAQMIFDCIIVLLCVSVVERIEILLNDFKTFQMILSVISSVTRPSNVSCYVHQKLACLLMRFLSLAVRLAGECVSFRASMSSINFLILTQPSRHLC